MKKNFNRAMSLVLAAAMALSLAACGGNQENNGSGGGTAGGYKNTLTWAQGGSSRRCEPCTSARFRGRASRRTDTSRPWYAPHKPSWTRHPASAPSRRTDTP